MPLFAAEMDNIWPVVSIVAGVIAVIVVLVFFGIFAFYFRLWIRAVRTGAKISVFDLMGMTFRKVRPNTIVQEPAESVPVPPRHPVSTVPPPENAIRTWTDNTGEFTMLASLVEVGDKTVKLRRQDGSVISVPRNRLSEGDQEFIDRQPGSADNPFQP